MTQANNIFPRALQIDQAARAARMNQRPCILWFTGLPASGKSTIASAVEHRLHGLGHCTYTLDGDNLRDGLNRDLGFSAEDRAENIRRVGEVARLMVDAGLIVLAAFISPLRRDRRLARGLVPVEQFLEIHVDVPLTIAEARDPKGLYRKARRGDLRQFTGIDSPYETPENPELVLDTSRLTVEDEVAAVVELLRRRGICRADV